MSLALLGLMVAAGVAGVAKASAALEHACCERPASDSAAPDARDCHGFLPLSCCGAAALPGSDAGVSAPIALTSDLAVIRLVPRIASHAPTSGPKSARSSPIRLSVVLQV